jgi:SAM-dependent methyltransferase
LARWWAEFNVAEPEELDYFRAAIRRYGEPVLDLGCGTGRILIPLLADGFDVDGCDVSADMIDYARSQAAARGFSPRLSVRAVHQIQPERTYRVVFMCGVFGIGGRRDHDRAALRLIHQSLESGGVLLIANHEFPYASEERRWARWLPGHRTDIPRDWPTEGERRATADGDEIELLNRLGAMDPLAQTATLQARVRLWHDGQVVREESHDLDECMYFSQEILLLLDEAGFHDIEIEAGFTGTPATADDPNVAFVARK